MKQTMNKYHKEHLCIPQIVEEEKESISKRFNRNKKFWIAYGILLIFSYFLLPIWMTSLICLGGFILFPATINQRDLLKENPFLVVDAKYVQFKGQILPWNRICKISISYETFKKKDISYNFTIIFKFQSGKEIYIDTCYFVDQQEIVNSIVTLAELKGISLETTKPLLQKNEVENESKS